MELQLTDAQVEQLNQIADHEGRTVSDLLVDAAVNVLEIDAHHLEAIDRALGQADRGEFIEEAEMDSRIARMLTRQ